MQAIILAAGIGSRLGKYTEEQTKCMLKVNDERLIDRMLNSLIENGVKNINIVVGYKADSLTQYINDNFKELDVNFYENNIYDKTNNIYSLYIVKHLLEKDDTILLESDLIYDSEIISKLIKDKRPNLATVAPYETFMDGTVLEIINDEIINFVNKAQYNFNNINNYFKTINIYKFSKEFSSQFYIPFLDAYIKAYGNNEYYEEVLRVINGLSGANMNALILDKEKWYEIDNVQDKEIAESIFAKHPIKKIQKTYGGYWRHSNMLDFCYLVNPYFPKEKMLNEMKQNYEMLLTQYPSTGYVQNELMSDIINIDSDQILVTNGATEIIKQLKHSINGTFGLIFPTFNEYYEAIGNDRIHKNAGANYDLNILQHISDKNNNVILINPDNPSGQLTSKTDVIELLDYMDFKNTGKLLILDESFIDFSEGNESLLNQTIIDKYPGLVLIKDISKSYGVPGLGLGIMVTSNTEVLQNMKSKMPIWNINSFAENFMQIFPKYKKDYSEACKLIKNSREVLYEGLIESKILAPRKSQSNYIMCEAININVESLANILLEKYNIFIKVLKGKIGLEHGEFVRISVRDLQDNLFIIKTLKEIEVMKWN